MSENRDRVIGGTIFLLCLGLLFLRFLSVEPGLRSTLTVAESRQMFQELGGPPEAKPVTMFVTSWCSVCRALQQQLTAAGISFIHVDVETNREAMLYYQRVTQGQTSAVPVTVVGDRVVLGYNLSEINQAYAALKN